MLEKLFLCGIGVRARREIRVVQVAVAPTYADFVGRIRTTPTGVEVVQSWHRILNRASALRAAGGAAEGARESASVKLGCSFVGWQLTTAWSDRGCRLR